jgi:hypothetical protein
MLIAMMLWSQRGLRQIHSLVLEDVTRIPDELAPAITLARIVGVSLPFLFAIAVARQGATPGKALMSLTVRNVATGGYPNYSRALGREALRFIHIAPLMFLGELHLLFLAVVAGVIFDMSRTRLSQTWYDRVLKTVIVAPVVERE